MASSGVLADFMKKPVQYKAIVFGGIGLALAGLYYQFGYSSLAEKLEAADSDSSQMRSRSKKLDADLTSYKALRQEMDELLRDIQKNQKALPSEAELPAFFETLNRKVTESGVEVRKWENKTDIVSGEFIKVPVEIEMTGNYFQIKRFFASLVQSGVVPAQGVSDVGERVVSIEDLQLTDPQVKNREIVMTAKFTASTFRQEDKTGAASIGGASDAAKASKGAKAKVEDAMKKQDDRNRAAAGGESVTPAEAAGSAKPPAGSAAAGKGGQ
jgi:type IV pilus assembly protein PilO